MKKLTFYSIFSIFLVTNAFTQTITLKGTVRDMTSEEKIAGATINLVEKGLTVVSDVNGYFQFTFPGQITNDRLNLINNTTDKYIPGIGIYFFVPRKSFISVEIVSLSGSIIDRMNFNSLESGTWCYNPELPGKGIYIFHLMLEGEHRTLKFMNSSDELTGNVQNLTKVDDNNVFLTKENNQPVSAKSDESCNCPAGLNKYKETGALNSVHTISVSKDGYNTNSISWTEKNNDSITVFILDTTARDGVRAGRWILETEYGIATILVNDDGKSIDSIFYYYISPCEDFTPLYVKDYGQAEINSSGNASNAEGVNLYFSDSLVAGTIGTPDEVMECSEAMVCWVAYCSMTCDEFGCRYTGYTWLPKIETTLDCKGSTSSNAALSDLTISTGTLTPVFNSSTLFYSCSLAAGVTSITVTPFSSDEGALIKINGSVVESGSGELINMTGTDTIKIEVMAIDGITKFTYRILVNMPSQWYSLGLQDKLITKIVASTANPTEIWAFDNDIFWGGIDLSVDGGKTWDMTVESTVGDKLPVFAVAPSNPDVAIMSDMWDGLSTNDGGENWDEVMPFPGGSNISVFCYNPLNENVVFCGNSPSALEKSVNRGITWHEISIDTFDVNPAIDIEISALDTQKIYIVSPETLYGGGVQYYGGIYKTTNGGLNWDFIKHSAYLTDLTLDPLNDMVAYVSVIDSGIMKTTDGGGTWNYINNGLSHLNVLCIAVDPVNSEYIYAGTENGGVYRSVNGGASWTTLNNGLTNNCIYSLSIDKNDPSIIYAGTSGGVFKFK